jgi:glycosyltransferase involved in cell wall biosynthesis
MRIAHVTATFPPYRAGTGNVCYHNAVQLVRHGHEVHVFTAAMTDAAAHEVCEGIVVHRLRPLVQIGNAPVLIGLLQALKDFELIHLHYPFILGAELVRLGTVLYRAPLIVSFHNDLIGDGARASIFSLYQRLSAVVTVRAASRLCAVSLDHYHSSRLRRMLRGQGPHAVELPNGVDIDRFHPSAAAGQLRDQFGIPADAKLILFVAALDRAHHFKGLGSLLQAVQALPPDVWLLIVGDGDLRPSYERQANDLGIAGRTIFAGAIVHEETPPFFCSADVTVLPSSPPESFGLVLIESLACGTPVITSDIPGVRMVVDHGSDGLLVKPGDPAALAGAIRQMLSDGEARRVMGQHGRAKIEARYDWGLIGARLEEIYQQVLDERLARTGLYMRGGR